jgi:hypothetical protein
MPRTSRESLDEIISKAVAPVVARASAAIAEAVAGLAEERIARELGRARSGGQQRRGRRVGAPRRRRNVEMTEWTADRRARRVPTFVIDMTGLDTKKKIVAKFGEGVSFQKGKPLPALKSEGKKVAPVMAQAARQVSAKPPRVRRAGGG